MSTTNIRSGTLVISLLVAVLFAWEIANMYNGIVLFPIAIVISLLIYVLGYDFLARMFPNEENPIPSRINSRTKEYMGLVALVLSLILVVISNRILMHSSEQVTAMLEKKIIWKSARSHCNELILKDDTAHCVNMRCWNRASVGNLVTLTPREGVFGLRKVDIECQ